jgi:hypothetical protein
VRCGSRLDESALVGDDDELGAAACVEFEKDAADVDVCGGEAAAARSAVSSLVSASATSSGSGRRVASW